MRIAILGYGSIGRRHARNLAALGHTDLMLYDPDPAALANHPTPAGAGRAATLEEAWTYDPEVVFVTSPTDRHVDLALDAARRDCDLFIEKPLSHRSEGVDELRAEVERRGLVSMVGCNMRFHPGPARVKQLLEAGAIGRVIAARIVTGSYLPDWRPGTDYRDGYSASAQRGGGAILDCIHEIDLSLWYLGPGTVVGAAAVPAWSIGLRVEGLAEILIRHDSGALSSVHLNFVERGYRRTCRFLGSEGAISWDFEGGGVVWQGSDGRARARYERPDDWCVNSMYVDEMKHFLECVSARTTPQGTLEEGSRALGIALGARRMASEGWNHAE